MKTILAPVDFSSATGRIVSEAVALARSFEGRVALVHVSEPTAGLLDYGVVAIAVAQVNEAVEKRAKDRLHEMEKQLEAEGVSVTSIHVTGIPVPEIIEQANTLSADYIVIGTHGHTAFYDLLVGSTAHGVLKRAKCPVVVVPPKVAETGEAGRG